MGGAGNRFCRASRVGNLGALLEEANKLYGRYRGVFKRANVIWAEAGKTPVNLADISRDEKPPVVNNSLDNDDWDRQFEACVDIIRDFIELSCQKAEELIGRIGGRLEEETSGPANN